MMKIRDAQTVGSSCDGFTIIEALIALLILSFAVLGIFRIHLQSVKTTAFNQRMLAGVQFARSGIEQLRSQAYSSLANTTDNSITASDFAGTDLKFLRQVTISNVSGINRTKKAKVEVGWDTIGDCTTGTMSGCDHTVILETYLTDLD